MELNVKDLKDLKMNKPENYVFWINKYAKEFGVNTPKRLTCFLANVLHETNNLKWMEELASGSAYEGRKDLGNTSLGDGKKYKGRGFGQVTGKYNYQKFKEFSGVDVISNPKLMLEPQYAVLSAFWFWKRNNLKKYADVENFRAVCSIWNTGKPNSEKINGWEDRLKKYELVKTWLKNVIS